MLHSVIRILSSKRYSSTAVATRVFSQSFAHVRKAQYDSQINYIKSIDDANAQSQDWLAVRDKVLSMRGNLTEKNVDAVILKIMVASKNLGAASSFVQYLKNSTKEDLSLGLINGILQMYIQLANTGNTLSKEQKQYILDTYKSLYEKYDVLDSSTCETLLHALCAINEWEKALKVLEDIFLSYVPTHSAFSTLIATFFRLNKKKKALEIIEQSIKHKRPLQHVAYEEWMKYILRKYKVKTTITKQMDEIFTHIASNFAIITETTANKMKELCTPLDWELEFTRLRKFDGQCASCKEKLDCMSLSNEEFKALQRNVKDKLIVGSDLLLKTTHDELKKFMDFVERTAPYDVVLDGLNISYALGRQPHTEKIKLLNHVVEYFVRENKKILLLGRKHMLNWDKKVLQNIMSKSCAFFTDNISQDDPFFITAAILSGPHTDIVSKDLLRGHQFNLKDENLKKLFKRWQWQHQWMVFLSMKHGVVIQSPLKFTPCAQKNNNTWHLPFESEIPTTTSNFNHGIPDMRSWICLRQK